MAFAWGRVVPNGDHELHEQDKLHDDTSTDLQSMPSDIAQADRCGARVAGLVHKSRCNDVVQVVA